VVLSLVRKLLMHFECAVSLSRKRIEECGSVWAISLLMVSSVLDDGPRELLKEYRKSSINSVLLSGILRETSQ